MAPIAQVLLRTEWANGTCILAPRSTAHEEAPFTEYCISVAKTARGKLNDGLQLQAERGVVGVSQLIG
jgi:hypothetical protein